MAKHPDLITQTTPARTIKLQVSALPNNPPAQAVVANYEERIIYRSPDGIQTYEECLYLFGASTATLPPITDDAKYIAVDTTGLRGTDWIDGATFIAEQVRLFLGGGGGEPPPVKSYP